MNSNFLRSVNAIAVGPDTKSFHIYIKSDITCSPSLSSNKMRRYLAIENFDNTFRMNSVSYGLTVTVKYSHNKTELRTGGNKL